MVWVRVCVGGGCTLQSKQHTGMVWVRVCGEGDAHCRANSIQHTGPGHGGACVLLWLHQATQLGRGGSSTVGRLAAAHLVRCGSTCLAFSCMREQQLASRQRLQQVAAW